VPHTPGFPAKFVGVDELHAAFLDESRTRGRCLVPRTGNPGISLAFREMWDSTALSLWLSIHPTHLAVNIGGIPYLAKNERDMGHPSVCEGTRGKLQPAERIHGRPIFSRF
jgi:hypothetical protein